MTDRPFNPSSDYTTSSSPYNTDESWDNYINRCDKGQH